MKPFPLLLAATFAAVPAAAQVRLRAPGTGPSALVTPGLSFDGAAPMPAATPVPLALIAVPIPRLSAASRQSRVPEEFSRAPSWFDVDRLTFDALIKAEGGGTVVMRYGWRSQHEMTVFAFPGGPSVAFKEYASNPMDRPKRAFEASLQTTAARREAANIIRAVQARRPVADQDQAVLTAVLAFLDGR